MVEGASSDNQKQEKMVVETDKSSIDEPAALKGLETLKKDVVRFSADIVKDCNADIEQRIKGAKTKLKLQDAHTYILNINMYSGLIIGWSKNHPAGSKVALKADILRGYLDAATNSVNNLYRAMGHGDLVKKE